MYYIDSHLADKITTKNLASLIDVSQGRLFRAVQNQCRCYSPSLHHHAARRAQYAMLDYSAGAARPANARVRIFDEAHLSRLFRQKNRCAPISLASRDESSIRRSGPLRKGFAC